MTKTIPIFFAIDNKYAPYLDCALRSIQDNASKEYNYIITVLYENTAPENLEKLKSAVKPPFEIRFCEMKREIEGLCDREENRIRCEYFTMSIFFRLFIADMFPEFDKGIYLDSDIIVPGDISKLYDIDLGDNLIGACFDQSVVNVEELAKYMEGAIGISRYKYINSGVLLMNLAKLREVSFADHFLYLLNKYHFDSVAPDQDYINAICEGKILFLDEGWNAMPTEGANAKIIDNPMLIHYNLFQKPWCYDGVPYEVYFWKYAKKSPFYDIILKEKNGFTDENKQADRKCLKGMIDKAVLLTDAPVTFSKAKNNGEKIKI